MPRSHASHGVEDRDRGRGQPAGWVDDGDVPDAGLVELYSDPPDDAPRPQNVREWRAWNDGRYRLRPNHRH